MMVSSDLHPGGSSDTLVCRIDGATTASFLRAKRLEQLLEPVEVGFKTGTEESCGLSVRFRTLAGHRCRHSDVFHSTFMAVE